jgi:CHAT domain-containing protein/Tfp pilus assembly protein PilF
VGRALALAPFALALAIGLSRVAAPQAAHAQTAELRGLVAQYMALYRRGAYAEAIPLAERAVKLAEREFGGEHPNVATELNNLAELHRAQGQHAAAEPLYRRSLAIDEKALGPEHPDVATSLNNLAGLYYTQGQHAAAEPLYRRSLAIWEKALGPEHPDVAAALNNLAALHRAQGQYAAAEPLYRRSLAIREKALGPEHPDVATSLNNLAGLHQAQGQYAAALGYVRRGNAILGRRFAVGEAGATAGRESEQRAASFNFLAHADFALAVAREKAGAEGPALAAEAFEAAQRGQVSSAARSLARTAARFAAGTGALAGLVRDRQDAADRLTRLEQAVVAAASQPPEKRDPAREQALRDEAAALTQRLAALDRDLAARFPEFAELSTPRPAVATDLAPLLAADEALLVYSRNWKGDATHLWVVRRDRAEALTLPAARDALTNAIAALRNGVELAGTGASLPVFDVELAYQLYQGLLAPAAPLLAGARHLIVVPDGPLASLPFAALVTEPTAPPLDFADYRKVSWLAKKYAITVLSAASSLRALRTFAKPSRATRPFVGYGDPLLAEAQGELRVASVFRGAGAVADVAEVRKLARLPDTAGELRALAGALGAAGDTVRLGRAASETAVKRADLSGYRVLAFATHGLLAGEIKGLPEPALVLTPPEQGSEDDDGLLTASEIAELKLDADWVVLSACNTALSEDTDAEGLSALAKAFFYAGARALLLSQWAVESRSAVRLTTATFAALAADPKLGRAEGLRRAMLTLLDDPSDPRYAHPAFWAPFVVIGEGGVQANR